MSLSPPSLPPSTNKGVFGFTYLLFQKKLLPFRYARLAAKLFFWPTIPITILNRWSNYWTAIDST